MEKNKKNQYQSVAVEVKTHQELLEITKQTGKKIYIILAEALEAYKKNLT